MAMTKKKFHYEAYLHQVPSQKIRLQIEHLNSGDYELQIVHHNKILKKTTFKKQ